MTSARRDALQRTLGDGFRIDRELGGGGMSQVFLARDLSLDRPVVVKVLPEELSAGVSAARFRREIQLVAKLQHPHIVPLLSAGDAEGGFNRSSQHLPLREVCDDTNGSTEVGSQYSEAASLTWAAAGGAA